MSAERVELPEQVLASIKAFRGAERDDRTERYIVLGYQDDKRTLTVVSQGDGGWAEAQPHLGSADANYVLLRKIHQVELAVTTKFVYIDWTPEAIKPTRKALLSTHKSQVEALLKPFHCSFQISNVSELSEEEVLSKIGFTSGTANHLVDKAAESKKLITPTGLTNAHRAVSSAENLSLENDEEIKQGIADVRNDASDINWVLVGYKDAKTLQYIAKGSGGIDELQSRLDDEHVYYALFRTTEQFDKSVTTKFGFVKLLSDQLPAITRAIYSTHMGFVTKLFQPYHMQFLLDEKIQLSQQSVAEQLQFNMGTRSRVLGKQEAEQKMKKNVNTYARSDLVATGSNDSIKFVNEDEFKQAIAEVRKDDCETTWFVAAYTARNTLSVVAKGSGDVTQLLEAVQDDFVNFGILRVTETIDKSVTTKFVYIKWQPATVPAMKKAEISTKKGLIDAIFSPYHVDFFIENKSEISTEIVANKVADASGSRVRVTDKLNTGKKH